jgi:hypothetical protein
MLSLVSLHLGDSFIQVSTLHTFQEASGLVALYKYGVRERSTTDFTGHWTSHVQLHVLRQATGIKGDIVTRRADFCQFGLYEVWHRFSIIVEG